MTSANPPRRRDARQRPYGDVLRVAAAFGAFALFLALVLPLTGVSIDESFRVALLLGSGSLGCGIAWGLARGTRRIDILELLGVGIALFTALYAVIRVLLTAVGLTPPGWLLPAVALVLPAAGWALARGRGSGSFVPVLRRPTLVAVAIGLVVFLLMGLLNLAQYSLGAAADYNAYARDMSLFESLGHALAQYGPSENGLMSGWPMRYHWLSYALTGHLTLDTGLEPFVALTRVLPLTAAVAISSVGATWVRSVRTARWAPIVVVLLLLVGSSVGTSGNRVVNWDSPSQSIASAWLACLLLIATLAIRGRGTRWMLVALPILGVAVGSGKTSAAGAAIGGLGLVALAALLFRRQAAARSLAVFALTAVPAFGAYLLVSSGQASSGGLVISPLVGQFVGRAGEAGAPFAAAVLAAGLLLGAAPRAIGLLPLSMTREARRGVALEYAIGAGASIVAVVAVLTLSGRDTNQSWFIDAACVPLAIVAVIGADRAWRQVHPTPAAFRGVHAVLLVLVLAMATVDVLMTRAVADSTAYPLGIPLPLLSLCGWLAASVVLCVVVAAACRARLRAPFGRVLVAVLTSYFVLSTIGYGVMSVVTSDRSGGARVSQTGIDLNRLAPTLAWLDAHAGADDILASELDTGGFTGALSRLRAYADGEAYAVTLTPVGSADELASRTSAIADLLGGRVDPPKSALCRDGVDWLVVRSATTLPTTLSPLVEHDDGSYAVLRLPC